MGPKVNLGAQGDDQPYQKDDQWSKECHDCLLACVVADV